MLKLENVSFSYGKEEIVKNLSFELKEGEVLGFLGPNGCGKTTTFRLICNLLQPDKGKITYFNKKVDFKIINEISYLIEERSLFPKYKVKDMLNYLGTIKGVASNVIKEKIHYWLNYFNMQEYENTKVGELSKGNQQKIQVISCLLNEPKLLVLDEPFSGLDVINQKEIMSVIKKLRDEGAMIIFSSHQINEVEKFCDKVCLISEGKMVLNGNIKDIKEDYKIRDIEVLCDNLLENKEQLRKIKGVISLKENKDGTYCIKVEDKKSAESVRDFVKKLPNLILYKESYAKLEEIFISKVGSF